MDYPNLKQLILSTPQCLPHVVINDMPKQDASGKDRAIADLLNQPAGTRIVSRFETALTLMATMGAISAATLLDKLESAGVSNSVLRWALLALKSERGIDVGNAETRAMLDSLAGSGVISLAEAEAVKALAVTPSSLALSGLGQSVTASDVSIALRNY